MFFECDYFQLAGLPLANDKWTERAGQRELFYLKMMKQVDQVISLTFLGDAHNNVACVHIRLSLGKLVENVLCLY